MAHFLCHLGAHILEPFCSISILPKTVRELGTAATLWEEYFNTDFNTFISKIFEAFNYTTEVNFRCIVSNI